MTEARVAQLLHRKPSEEEGEGGNVALQAPTQPWGLVVAHWWVARGCNGKSSRSGRLNGLQGGRNGGGRERQTAKQRRRRIDEAVGIE